ncbi:M20/M25/M40 family metallo-hydrolase [Winogradskyella sp. 3972H.M.0a.05]|uniref:M20/M25/M40 family metallo-hydrolase n=1 Tax=Winogradskyella sp. 3972H.M.0a.05 TaxID=2950277 RepID=UPI0033937BA9
MKTNSIAALLCALFSCTVNAQTFDAFYGSLVDNVSYTNILNDLTTFENFGVKEVGTNALTNAENWIVQRYQNLGYTNVELQEFTYASGTSNNIIITKTGTVYPNTFLIIDGHYDTINGPGANDNGSGTVLILELARLLKDVDTEYSIKFIHFSGEEDGLWGSSYYVNNTVNPQNLNISLVFNIDEVGGVSGQVNDTIVCEEDRSSPPTNNAASTEATIQLANCMELYSNLNTEISFAYGSDYIPFENNGEVITGLFEKNQSPYAHSPNDTLANMDVSYLTEVTKGSLGAALHFAIGTEALSTPQFTNDELKIYNDTSTNTLHIDFETPAPETPSMYISDTLGKIVLNSTSLENQFNSISTASLSKGIYVVNVSSGSKSLNKKIVIH